MNEGRKFYGVADRSVVAAAAIYAVWRWRRWVYAAIIGGAIWRVLLVAAIVSVGFFVVDSRSVKAQGYPGGTRDPDEWYYCYSSRYNPEGISLTGIPWDSMHCEQLLWQESTGGGGIYESLQYVGGVQVEDDQADDGEIAVVRGWIIPSQGIKRYQYSCSAGASYCNYGNGSYSAGVIGQDANVWFNAPMGFWSISNAAPSVGACATASINVVSDAQALGYDKFYSPDMVTGWTTVSGNDYPFTEAQAATINNNRSGGASYSCSIIAWEHWPEWLVTNPPWVPDIPDSEPTPSPISWVPVPWVPITDTTNAPVFDIGPGVDGGCHMVIPQQSVEIGGNQYGWYGFEICRTDFELGLSLFGEDVDAWLNVVLALGGLGIVFSIIKRS